MSTTATAHLSSSSSSSNDHQPGLHVRFDNQCVLIPDTFHRSKRLSKSYSLPLWKRKSIEDAECSTVDKDDTHVVIKVPLPSFMSKSRSPTRGRESERVSQPLASCLVHRGASASPHRRPRPIRTPSLPLCSAQTTVPLRACCPDCIHITEECLKEGEHWQVKFSRGASRKRSASLDIAGAPSASGGSHTHRPRLIDLGGACTRSDEPLALGSGFPAVFSITVDEVDRRRRSIDYGEDDLQRDARRSSDNIVSDHDRGRSLSSSSSVGSDEGRLPLPPKIEEEDEDQLFPLPSSPRRSPTTSPIPSPSHSPSVSPTPSPNTSTSCLAGAAARSLPYSHSSSHDTLLSSSGSDESNATPAGTRKARYVKGFLTPDQSPELVNYIPSALTDQPPPPPPPSPSSLLPTPGSSPLSSFVTPAMAFPSSHSRSVSHQSRVSNTAHNHTRAASSPSTSSRSIPAVVPISPPISPPPSPVLARSTTTPPSSPVPRKKRPSFSGSLLRVGADVLKGVGSIGSGAV